MFRNSIVELWIFKVSENLSGLEVKWGEEKNRKKKKTKPIKTHIQNYLDKMVLLPPSSLFASDSFFVSCFSLLLSSLSEIFLVRLLLLLHYYNLQFC